MAKTRKNNGVNGLVKKVGQVAKKIVNQTIKAGKYVINSARRAVGGIVKKAQRGGRRSRRSRGKRSRRSRK